MRFAIAVLLYSSLCVAHIFEKAPTSLDPRLNLTIRSGHLASSPSVSYEIVEQNRSVNQDVVYFLHGGSRDTRQVELFISEMNRLVPSTRRDLPRFISVSYGPLWLATPKNSAPASGIIDDLRLKVFPEIENQLLRGIVGGRHLVGLSMGGFNALMLSLAAPTAFQSVTLLSAGYVDLSPFANESQINQYCVNLRVPPGGSKFSSGPAGILRWMRTVVDTEVTWQNIGPRNVLNALASRGVRLPITHLVGDDGDEMFFRADFALYQAFAKVNPRTSWSLVHGDHGDFDASALHQMPFWQ